MTPREVEKTLAKAASDYKDIAALCLSNISLEIAEQVSRNNEMAKQMQKLVQSSKNLQQTSERVKRSLKLFRKRAKVH